MYDLQDDHVTSEETTNYKATADGKKEMQLERLEMNQYNFYPSLEITLVNDTPELRQQMTELGIIIDNTHSTVLKGIDQYLTIVLQVREKMRRRYSYTRTPFRLCKVEDFKKRKLLVQKRGQDRFEKRFCPDTEEYRVQNLRNMEGVISFSVNIEKCNVASNPNCKNIENEQFDKIMKNLYFTLNYLQESAELNNYDLGE